MLSPFSRFVAIVANDTSTGNAAESSGHRLTEREIARLAAFLLTCTAIRSAVRRARPPRGADRHAASSGLLSVWRQVGMIHL